MAKFFTKRKSRTKVQPEQIQQLSQSIDQAVQYVSDWQRKELINMSMAQTADSLPICIPVGRDRYVVGSYGLQRQAALWQVTKADQIEPVYFSTRSTALLYLLCVQTRHKNLAKEIQQYDTAIIKLREDYDLYTNRLQKARKKKDYWRVDHLVNRSSDIECKLNEAKNQLRKSIDLAKYFKIWD